MNKEPITFLSASYSTFDENGYLYQLVKDRKLTNILHNHNFFEILLLIDGEAEHNLNGEKQRIQKGEFVFLTPEQSHRFESQSETLYIFSLSVLPEKISRFLSAMEVIPKYGKIYKLSDERLIKEILILPTYPANQQKHLINSILATLLSIVGKSSDQPIGVELPYTLQTAIENIRRPENLIGGVERLATLAGYSRMHLGRITKKYFGKKPSELIYDIRIHLAKEYLENTSFSIEYIAERIGFSTPSQFFVSFKKRFHLTPTEYRKRKQAQNLLITFYDISPKNK